jgi:acyl-CoA synthetase (NDP forming)
LRTGINRSCKSSNEIPKEVFLMSIEQLEEIFHPDSIAVAGASSNKNAAGNNFTDALIKYGFRGKIYPINPKHKEILGMTAYPRVQDVPGPVDYVISCIPARGVLDLVEDCAQKKVKAIHFFTARFSETGRKDAAQLEQEMLARSRKAGIRLIGPNCMGLYYPALGISFSDAMPHKSGDVALISQSGQMTEEMARYAALRGVYFSKAISYGNALDFNECDYLEYFAADPETRVILMYIEGLREGRRFINTLSEAASQKPVIILKGGRGESGTRAASSHTASLAGTGNIWHSMVNQAGAVSAESQEEIIDLATGFSFLPSIKGFRVGVGGGGGGSSVTAADLCEEEGLDVIPLPQEIRELLKEQGSKIWDWVSNPVDMSIRDSADFTPGVLLRLMAENANFDLLLGIMGDPHHERHRDRTAESYLKEFNLEKLNNKPFLAVVPDKSLGADDFDHWTWKVVSELRTKLLEQGIPFFPTVGRAARVARKIAEYYRRKG